MKKTVVMILGLLLATFLVVMLLVPAWRDTLIGRVRGEPFYDGRPSSFWIKQLQDKDVMYRTEAAHNLRSLLQDKQTGPVVAPDAVPALISRLRDEDEDPHAREAAMAALRYCTAYRDDLVLIFVEGVRDRSRLVRIEAARALGDAGDKDVKVIAALVERLEEDDDPVRKTSTTALIKLAPESIPLLIEALGDENFRRRLEAGDALEKIGPPAVPQLTKALTDSNYDRKQAAKAILQAIQMRYPKQQ